MTTMIGKKAGGIPKDYFKLHVAGLLAGFAVLVVGLYAGSAVFSAIGFLAMSVSTIFVNYSVQDKIKSVRRKCGPRRRAGYTRTFA